MDKFLKASGCSPQGNESLTFEASYEDEDDDGLSDNDSSFDDDVRVYKNPRNLPSTHCPRDEERTIVLVNNFTAKNSVKI